MEMKRKPILKKIRSIVLMISIVALLITSAVGLLSMLMIKSESEMALTDQMEQNLHNIVSSKADLAHSELGRYSGYIKEFAEYANWLYRHPESFVAKPVLPPDAQNAGAYSMQRYLTSEKIALEQIESEIALLGNLEQIWYPVISANSDMITTIYYVLCLSVLAYLFFNGNITLAIVSATIVICGGFLSLTRKGLKFVNFKFSKYLAKYILQFR